MGNKIGRNNACPCGSGKKYKRCCLDLRQVPPVATKSEPTKSEQIDYGDDDDDEFRSTGVTPYALARFFDEPGEVAPLDDSTSTRLGYDDTHRWTLRKLAEMSTDDIVQRLGGYGVDFSRERFEQLAQTTFSAWSISESWRGDHAPTCTGKDAEFPGLAACELWKRFLPHRPSIEMLYDWWREGYRLADGGDASGACDTWWKVWETMRGRFSPQMTRSEDTLAVFDVVPRLREWCWDFQHQLLGCGFRGDVKYAQLGYRFADELLRQFPDDPDAAIIATLRAKAEHAMALDRTDEGIGILEGVVARWPRDATAYLDLAELFLATDRAGPRDVARARYWAERASADDELPQRARSRLEELRFWIDAVQEAEGRGSQPTRAGSGELPPLELSRPRLVVDASDRPKELLSWSEIRHAFDDDAARYQREAVSSAIACQQLITPRLVDFLGELHDREHTTSADTHSLAAIYAVMLLGYFQEPAAHQPLLALASLPSATVDLLLGDVVTEDLPWILFATCDDGGKRLETLVLDPAVDVWCRTAAMYALSYCAASGERSRDEMLSFFAGLLTGTEAEPGSYFWDGAANVLCDLCAIELAPTIASAYERGLISAQSIDYRSFRVAFARGEDACLAELRSHLVRELSMTPHERLSKWACFTSPETTPPRPPRQHAPENKRKSKQRKARRLAQKRNRQR